MLWTSGEKSQLLNIQNCTPLCKFKATSTSDKWVLSLVAYSDLVAAWLDRTMQRCEQPSHFLCYLQLFAAGVMLFKTPWGNRSESAADSTAKQRQSAAIRSSKPQGITRPWPSRTGDEFAPSAYVCILSYIFVAIEMIVQGMTVTFAKCGSDCVRKGNRST